MHNRPLLYGILLLLPFTSLQAQEAGLVIRHRPQEKVMRETWVEISTLVGGKEKVESVFLSTHTTEGQPLRLDLTGTCRKVATEIRVMKPGAAVREGTSEGFKSVATPAIGSILQVLGYSPQRRYYQILLEDNKSGYILDTFVKPVSIGEVFTGYLPKDALAASSLKYTISAVGAGKKVVTTPEYTVAVNPRMQSLAPAAPEPPQIKKECKSRWPYYLVGGAAVVGGVFWTAIPTPDEEGDMTITVNW